MLKILQKSILFLIISYNCYSQITDLSVFASHNIDSNIVMINHHNFLIYYDTTNQIPKYAIHILYNTERKKSLKKGGFRYDRQINKRYQRGKEYYKRLNKNGHIYDKGHIVPYADMSINIIIAKETMVYTNCVPQYYKLNRNGWRKIEDHFRKFIEDRSGFLIVIR